MSNTPRVLASPTPSTRTQTNILAAAPGKTSAELEVPKEHKHLIEANAIVKYFAIVGKNSWVAPDLVASLKENALIEFEESVLGGLVKTNAEEALKLAEGVLEKAGLDAEKPTPATVVLFSRLYNVATKALKLGEYPELAKWFTAALGTEWAKAGIEKVAGLTTAKSVKPTKGGKVAKEAAKVSEPAVPREVVTKLKEGIFKKIPEVGKDM